MELKDQFDAIDYGAVMAMIAEGREEDVRLDFKTVSASDLSKRDERKNFAICVSGFANSSGGIVIWGVDARRDESGIDRAVAPAELDDVGRFASRLKDLTPSSVSPPVDGLTHKALMGSSGRGFAVTLVPESSSTPHMAKLGENRYYKRNSSSFYVLEHFDLEDMFGRRHRPSLQIVAELKNRPDDDPHEEIHFWLSNNGRAVAKHAGLHCDLPEGSVVAGVRGSLENVSNLNSGRPTVSFDSNVSVIHPNGIRVAIGHAIIQRPEKGTPLRIAGKIFCEHMAARDFEGVLEVKPLDPPVSNTR